MFDFISVIIWVRCSHCRYLSETMICNSRVLEILSFNHYYLMSFKVTWYSPLEKNYDPLRAEMLTFFSLFLQRGTRISHHLQSLLPTPHPLPLSIYSLPSPPPPLELLNWNFKIKKYTSWKNLESCWQVLTLTWVSMLLFQANSGTVENV